MSMVRPLCFGLKKEYMPKSHICKKCTFNKECRKAVGKYVKKYREEKGEQK